MTRSISFHRKDLLILLFLACTVATKAQKKPLDHDVYDGWKSLQSITISDDGRYVGTLISPQEGDTLLLLRDLKEKRELKVDRVKRYAITSDGAFTVGLVKAPFAERREARIKKEKADQWPKDTLIIIRNASFGQEKIAEVKSFTSPEKMNRHFTYTLTQKTDTTNKKEKSGKDKELLIVRNLETGHEDTVLNAKGSIFNKYGNTLAINIEPDKKDTTDTPGVLFFDLKRNMRKRISNEKATYRSLSFDEKGDQLVYLCTVDTSKNEQKAFDIRYHHNENDSAIILAAGNAIGLPDGYIFDENAAPRFSENGERILIGVAPLLPPKDTTIVEFETASLDLWHWRDPLVQPQQLAERKRKERQTYTGLLIPSLPNHFRPIADKDKPYCTVSDEGNGRFVLLWSDDAYLIENQWDISPKYDTWVLDLETGRLDTIATPLAANPSISPAGNFIYWWDAHQRQWIARDNRDGNMTNLTASLPVNFWNEKNDIPFLPGSYGIAGWTENDDDILVNDAFDIWKIDPDGKNPPVNITEGAGRNDSTTFRYINTDPEERFIDLNRRLLLFAFDNHSKQSGYYTLEQIGKEPLKRKIMDNYSFSSLIKAKEKDICLFRKGNFQTYPDLYVTTNLWKTTEKLTDINPQMRDYNWGTAELFSWNSFTGLPHQGIVYKPEDFDSTKKYPVLIYFYEKHSDELYRYFSPAPSRSVINIPFFVSRGYVVFTPDIHYTVGHPGQDAYNSVVSGAEALAKNPWIDKDNMAIQGQSWGGYQVAYLITKTNLFKAAGAGAPVSNMTSAYGGIRWDSGRSRQFQYEQTQSRIGAPMSDSLQLYIENSPVFFAKNVETPLLIMHNDKDGAVPWYQGIEYFMTLRRLGKPVWLLQYNNEKHNLSERRNAKDLSIRLQQFFDHYLKGAPAPVWMTDGIPATEKGKTWGYEIRKETE